MELKCLGTGSKGNCYILKSKNDTLILDCGLNYSNIISDEFIGDPMNIRGCLITHSHKDHSKSEKDMKLSGIKMLTYNNITINKKYYLGSFEIMPFGLYHDVSCYGFLIRDLRTMEVLCYATDTCKLPLIKGVDYWLVECNYCEDILQSQLSYEYADYNRIERLRRTHMGDETLKEYFKTLKYIPKRVLLVHQSNSGHYNSKIALDKFRKVLNSVEDIVVNKVYNLKGSE